MSVGKRVIQANLLGFLGCLEAASSASDLHGFKLQRCFPLGGFHQGCGVAHRVAAVGAHVPGGDDDDDDGDDDGVYRQLVSVKI